MRTFLRLSLFIFLLFITIGSIAQTDQFAYAITDIAKEGSSWKVLRKLNLKTGEYSSVLFDGMDKKALVADAATKKAIDLSNLTNDKLQQLPFTTGVAAIALDKKHNRLYFTPMSFNQLRYIDLSTMKVYYVTDQSFLTVNKRQNDPGKTVSRMVITADGTGYAISNDASDFIQFTTGKNIIIKQLGSLIDDPANKNISVHNACSSYGGDIVSDDKGALYLLTGPNNVFKVNPETKIATHLGAIQGLPKDFTTNAAVVTSDGQLLISSAVGKGSNYLLDIKTLKAVSFENTGIAYHTSDLANSNYLSTSKNPFKQIPTVQSLKSNLSSNIQIYPNPVVDDSRFMIQFNGVDMGAYIVEMVDLAGRPVLRKNIVVSLKNSVQNIPVAITNAKGLYLVRVVGANKKSVFEQKLMVQ